MKINNNMSARITNKQLLRTENNLTKSMERLSSGLKINHAKDNPAGMAISNKMRAQIAGLDRASSNASDGISLIQIADGALNETTSILQRMRELSVQAANDTNSLGEREAIQKEIDSLKEEITRISTDTEYNAMPLLDGSLDTRVYAKNVSRINISDFVEPGNYKLTIDAAATQATAASAACDYTDNTSTIGEAGTVSINGSLVSIEADDTYAEVYEKIRDAAEIGEVSAGLDVDNGNAITFTSDAYGDGVRAEITCTSAALADALGFAGNYTEDAETGECTITETKGTDAKITLDTAAGSKFSETSTIKQNGNKITITDSDGFSLSFLVDEGYTGEIDFEVTDIGTMTLHIGANMDQNMEVRIPEVSSKSLYVEEIDVTTVHGADNAIIVLDEAIAQVSEARSKLGAYQNRLESSVDSLDAFEENMTSALSRLSDADMAEEMSTYTQQNVLNQAAISVLTQANDLPQQVLQILQ